MMKTIKTHTRGFYNCEVWCRNPRLPALFRDYVGNYYAFHAMVCGNDNEEPQTKIPLFLREGACLSFFKDDVRIEFIFKLFSFWLKNVLQRAIKGGRV